MKKLYKYNNGSIQLIINEIPLDIDFDVSYDNESININSDRKIQNNILGIEVSQNKGGRICYGLLVAKLSNRDNNETNISIAFTKENKVKYTESILENDAYVFKGLPQEYLDYTKEGIKSAILRKVDFPNCNISIVYSANCEVGSSPMFFKLIAESLVDLICCQSICNLNSLEKTDISHLFGFRFNLKN